MKPVKVEPKPHAEPRADKAAEGAAAPKKKRRPPRRRGGKGRSGAEKAE